MLDQRSILITGGTGSFGQKLVREILTRHKPERLIVFSRDEQKQYRMAQVLSPQEHPSLRYFIGDVRDEKRLRRAMDGVDFVVHAAAMKHVPIAEYNPFECIKTNVIGAMNVIESAIDTGVRRVIALSTDKAANPINLYGATKLCSDKCFVSANHMAVGSGTRFSVVRYGNVIGSRGSVVEHFQELVAQGESELPVTDLRMTRFWLKLSQGVNFVLQRLQDMEGGEIFVPKIPTMRIKDLARAIGPRCQLREIGARPGEKMHEVLIPYDEAKNTLFYRVSHEDQYFVVQPTFNWWNPEDHIVRNQVQGQRLPENWQYRSDPEHNDEVLSAEQLRRLLQEDRDDARTWQSAA